MKALIYTHYGTPDVLRFKEIAKPVPTADEISVIVHATTVNRTDCAIIAAKPVFARFWTGLFGPQKQTPGTEFAGEVTSVGEDVTAFRVGDRVFGFDDRGALSHAEYLCIAQDKVLRIPEGVSFEEAAAGIEGAHYAYNFINKVPIAKGQHVLVNGATGAIGSAAVQLLRHYGIHVTAVCSAQHRALVSSLGAEHIIDYTSEDFTQSVERYDYIFDTVGKSSFFRCFHLLKPGGAYISSDLGFLWQNIFLPLLTPYVNFLLSDRRCVSPFPSNIPASLRLVKKLKVTGEFKAVIDRYYPFDKIVEAYRYVQLGHKKGSVLVTMKGMSTPEDRLPNN